MIGQTISHYRILEKLGQGGMGDVYRAEDTNLSRQVAIKVLPDEFAQDAERLARFEREAKLLASLNHPNIASIYGLEQADGKPFLVLELVEGQTLAERLKKGRVPLDETLDICRQIAEGLEAAHERGIVHRDLKPANVKLTPEGKVKVLDFGLARALQDQAATADLSHSPTITAEMTRPGVILGTAAYMSPEQAKGRTVDRRADVWAFGCVLYECLTAKKAFRGDSITEVMAKILEAEPDFSQLPANTPPIVRSLLRRCLQKEPSLRLRDIGDARLEMQEGISEPVEVPSIGQRLALRSVASIGAAALLIGVLIGLAVMKYSRSLALPTAQPVARSLIRLEPDRRLAGMNMDPWSKLPTRTAMAMSNAGRFLVYSACEEVPSFETNPQLYVRRIDQIEARPIPGTKGGIYPFLSPDDRWVGFWAEGKLKKVAIDGGVPVTLCDSAGHFGATWGSDNSIVFCPGVNVGLSRISAGGGTSESLTKPDRNKEEGSHRLPHYLPDGKGALFTIMKEWSDLHPRIALLDLQSRQWRVLLEDAADARYVPTGHIVFLREGMLMAAPFDLNRLELAGQPAPVAANVMQSLNYLTSLHNTAAGQYAVSDSGCLVYATGDVFPDFENSLMWVDSKGTAGPIASFKAPIFFPRLSPDGKRIAYTTQGRESRVWVYDIARGTASGLTGKGKTAFVDWTPDMRRVVFGWRQSGETNLFWQLADGSSPMERLTTSEYRHYPGSVTPDGAVLAFVEGHPDTGLDILLLDLQSRQITPFLNSPAAEGFPELSPDGKWMAYVSDESGREEIYVRPFPGPGGKWLISNETGWQPLWARNGKKLFYRRGTDQVWVVDVRMDNGFAATRPRLLFEKSGYVQGSPIRGWDISLDGQRFLMVKYEEIKLPPATEMILVQNWFEELKRLVPTGRN